jgi:elongation factor 2
MARATKIVEKVTTLMDKPELIRNIGIVAHIDHGKTTLSDNLLAGAGMISEELAGKQLFMDSDEEEQARGITIDASNVSMVHEYEGKSYLINMIDTPGHVDFTYEVSRCLAACEGALLVVDATQGVEAQTIANAYLAIDAGLRAWRRINKIDLPSAEPERIREQIEHLVGLDLVRAFYSGDVNFADSFSGLLQTVNPLPPTTTPNPVDSGLSY